MQTQENERIVISLARYEQCLNGDFQHADTLARALCCEKELWSKFCRGVIANHGRMTREQIRVKILGFLCGQAQEALMFCRRGQNRLHDINNSIEACQYFLAIFCGPKPGPGLIGNLAKIPQQHLDPALSLARKILGMDADELSRLVLEIGSSMIKRCHAGYVFSVHELVILGADFALDIEVLGSTAEEVQKWLFAADLKAASNAYARLLEQPLHALMADSEETARHLQIVTDCLETDAARRDQKGGPWFMRNKLITANDLHLKPEDFEYIRRIQREFEARISF